MTNDTIAAISTAPGEAGISIVRVSGPMALKIADKICRTSGKIPSKRAANTFLHGFIHHENPESEKYDIDEVILLIYRAPNSYTRENVVEIQGHGGRVASQRILRTVLEAGARMAEPGEFTRRAFLSGRLDLLQAEAVMDLIRAKTDKAASVAVEQLEGGLSRWVTMIYENLISVAADIEATLDFGENELPTSTFPELTKQLKRAKTDLQELLDSWEEGHLLREGALVVISGSPNVGKSTLMNSLVGTNRAIVTDTPGTTRDTIEEQIIVGGIPVRLIDTAGLRDTECNIEKEGMRRAHISIKDADINLCVFDQSELLSQSEKKSLSMMDKNNTIIILNKEDLGTKLTQADFTGFTVLSCSLIKETTNSIQKAILSKLGLTKAAPTPHAVISERHRNLVQIAQNELNDAVEILKLGKEEQAVLAATSLRASLESLGELTGRIYSNDLLDNVFNKFCIGK